MPDKASVHVDRPLTDISLHYRNPSYCGDVLAPPVKVVKESDKYFVYGRENFRVPNALRADKSKTQEIAYSVSTDSYFCEEYGFHELISDRERGNSDEALRPEIDTTEHLTDCLMLDREYRVANLVLDSTNPEWGAYNSSHFSNLALAWDDKAGADVRADFYFARFTIFRDSRRQANTAFLPTEVSYQLAQMEQVDELRKYTDPGLVTNSGIPPTIFGLRVVECESSYNSADEGLGTATFEETFGNNVIISYINPRPLSLKTLTFMLTFKSQQYETRKWRDDPRKADVVEVCHLEDPKIVAPACGFVYTNVMTQSV
jgi:hypothetical protein